MARKRKTRRRGTSVPSAEDRAEVARGGGSARDRAEVAAFNKRRRRRKKKRK